MAFAKMAPPSGGEPKLTNVLTNAPEVGGWGEAHSSILRYEGEPISEFVVRHWRRHVDADTKGAALFGYLIMDARGRNLPPMSEWWLGTIIATWCVALAGSEGLEEAPSVVFCLLAVWCGIFSVQLLAGQPWEAGATFVAFLVAGAINSQMQRVRQSRNE